MSHVADISVDTWGTDRVWAHDAWANGFRTYLSAEDAFSTRLDADGERAMCSGYCGIYFWIATDGEVYIGQSVDIRSRLRAHQKTYHDLRFAAVFPCDRKLLDEEEKAAVRRLEGKWPLRNVLLVQESACFRPLDKVISSKKQRRFIRHGNPPNWYRAKRQNFSLLRRREKARVSELKKQNVLDLVQGFVSFFANSCILSPCETEHSFWSVTGFEHSAFIARVNAGVQEVFTVNADQDGLFVRLIGPDCLSDICNGPIYETSSWVSVLTPDEFVDLLEDSERLSGMRQSVLHLMRHTTALNKRSHCPSLFDPELIRLKHNDSVVEESLLDGDVIMEFE